MSNGSSHPLAQATAGYANGHYWNHFEEADPPDHPIVQYFLNEEVRGFEALPPEHRPAVPERVDWSQYVHYICRWSECTDNCINRADSPYAQTKSCRACYAERSAEELTLVTHHLPEWAKELDAESLSAAEPARLVEDGGSR